MAAKHVAKAVLDRAAAALALLALSPVFLAIALLVKRDGGPAFYGHARMGLDGKPFRCWKFRSMAVNAKEMLEDLLAKDPVAHEEWEKNFKLKDDPRVTRIGAFLRKTSIDELPQLYNVLKGEMSLVGPRPIVEAEKKYYGDAVGEILSVRPGITGLWQISGRSDVTYGERVALDKRYVSGWTVPGDIWIMLKTVDVMLRRKGAY